MRLPIPIHRLPDTTQALLWPADKGLGALAWIAGYVGDDHAHTHLVNAQRVLTCEGMASLMMHGVNKLAERGPIMVLTPEAMASLPPSIAYTLMQIVQGEDVPERPSPDTFHI